MSEDKPYENPKPEEDKYGMKPKKKTPREIMQQTPPHQQMKNKNESFKKAWDDLIKFGDCPVCHGDPMRCPESDKPASACSRRRNAMKHSRGSVARQMARMTRR
jgi:hypothetical protein